MAWVHIDGIKSYFSTMKLNVDFLISGKVTKLEQNIIVSVKLINVESAKIESSDQKIYTSPLAHALTIK